MGSFTKKLSQLYLYEFSTIETIGLASLFSFCFIITFVAVALLLVNFTTIVVTIVGLAIAYSIFRFLLALYRK